MDATDDVMKYVREHITGYGIDSEIARRLIAAEKRITELTAEKKSFSDGLLQSGAVVLRQSGEIAILKDEISRLKG